MYHSTGHGWGTVRMGEPGGTFWCSQKQQFSLLAAFPVPAQPCRHRKAGPALVAWQAGTQDLDPMPVCPSHRKNWPNNWIHSRHKPSRCCSLPSPASPCPRTRWAWAFPDPYRASITWEGQTSKCPFSSFCFFFKLRITTHGYKSLRRRLRTC